MSRRFEGYIHLIGAVLILAVLTGFTFRRRRFLARLLLMVGVILQGCSRSLVIYLVAPGIVSSLIIIAASGSSTDTDFHDFTLLHTILYNALYHHYTNLLS